jgi:hypothetical protein
VEAIDKHASLRFSDSHHHPLPHKPQLDALGREMVVDEVPLGCFTGTCLRNGVEELFESWSNLAELAERQWLQTPELLYRTHLPDRRCV